MMGRLRFCHWLVVVVAFLPTGIVAQTKYDAQGGVAANRITDSTITINNTGLPPDDQLRMIRIFSEQIAVSRRKGAFSTSNLTVELCRQRPSGQ